MNIGLWMNTASFLDYGTGCMCFLAGDFQKSVSCIHERRIANVSIELIDFFALYASCGLHVPSKHFCTKDRKARI